MDLADYINRAKSVATACGAQTTFVRHNELASGANFVCHYGFLLGWFISSTRLAPQT